MGFNIHVAGSGRFRYSNSNVPYGDEWELSWMTTHLLGRVGVSSPPSLTGGAVGHVLTAMSRITQVHLLISTFESLMMDHGEGTLNVTIRHSHALWPTTGGFRSISISGSSGGPVTADLCRFLDDHDMNKWGPFMKILNALGDFNTTYRGSRGYLINITLSD